MQFLVDTDVCSAHLRGKASATAKFFQYAGRLSISVLTLGELLSWTRRKNAVAKHQSALDDLLTEINVLPVDAAIAEKFGSVRAELLDRGHVVATIDLLIASTALLHGLTVVTHNTRHFQPVPGLSYVDWLEDERT